MQLPTNREEYTRQGGDVQEGIFDIDENTPMGIIHGDNSGMYAAFQHGFESYGVDILNRILELVDKHEGDLPGKRQAIEVRF